MVSIWISLSRCNIAAAGTQPGRSPVASNNTDRKENTGTRPCAPSRSKRVLSRNQRPIHAGLLGIDSLFIVDEAHISEPFVQTLRMIRESQAFCQADAQLPPLQFVTMSATLPSTEPPSISPQSIFTLDSDDRSILAPRIRYPKWIQLIKPKKRDESSFIETIITQAIQYAQDHPGHIGAIVVNRVQTARAVFDRLSTQQSASSPSPIRDVALFTGRIRAIDRQHLLVQYLPQIQAQNRPHAAPKSGMLWIVATQTIEVGADFDFDMLISENAPIDALRQRWGRLNRLGQRAEASGILIHHPSSTDASKRVYSEDVLKNTWDWLNKHHGQFIQKHKAIDCSTDALDCTLKKSPPNAEKPLTDPPLDAPVLTWSHMTALSQTRPALPIEPDIVPFLHGKRRDAPDVHVIWRHDLSEPLLTRAQQDRVAADAIQQVLTWVPPSSQESLDLPIWIVTQWLSANSRSHEDLLPLLIDYAGPSDQEEDRFNLHPGRIVWNYHRKQSMPVDQIKPDDTIILPASYGGVDTWGFNPNVQTASDVADQIDTAYHQHWRLTDSSIKPWADPSQSLPWQRLLTAAYHDDTPRNLLQTYVDEFLATVPISSSESHLFNRYQSHRATATIVPYPDSMPRGLILLWSDSTQNDIPLNLDSDDHTNYLGDSSYAAPITLQAHHEATEQWIVAPTNRQVLPFPVRDVVALAGRYHDLGKLDPRFQLLLHHGDAIATAIAPEPLAKSRLDSRDQPAYDYARRTSKYPQGMRHEELSTRLVKRSNTLLLDPTLQAFAPLLWHLIASHHGWGRPWLPVPEDASPVQIDTDYDSHHWSASSSPELGQLDSGWSEQFDQLQEHWGFWGLAYLETVLRLADYQASITKGGPLHAQPTTVTVQ